MKCEVLVAKRNLECSRRQNPRSAANSIAKRFRPLTLALVAWAVLGTLCAAAEPPLVPLAEVGQHVGKEVTVEMVVASSRQLDSGSFCFLNSKKSFTDKDNFTVAIRGAALAKFAQRGIATPAEHYAGKTIRVTGKISLHRDQPQILVDKPEQVVLVVKLE